LSRIVRRKGVGKGKATERKKATNRLRSARPDTKTRRGGMRGGGEKREKTSKEGKLTIFEEKEERKHLT